MIDKEKLEKELKAATLYINAGYILTDVVNTFLVDADTHLEVLKKELRQRDKQTLMRIVKKAHELKKLTAELTKPMYEMIDAGAACDDSDYLASMILMIIDRTGGSMEEKEAMIEMMKKLPSKAHLNRWINLD